jgi:ADP-L-glycero-D-manno-heptose 6-epimerase
MTIVVTGSSGFIGSNLIQRLVDTTDIPVLGVDFDLSRSYSTKCAVTSADEFINSISRYNIDYIFHEGAISSTTETDWGKLRKYNIDYTWNLIYYCRDNNIPLQYASSASVYGNPSREQWSDLNKPLNPLNLYAKSKQQIDYITDSVIKSRRPPILLQGMRYFNVYGPNEDHKGDQASPYHKFKKQLLETGRIKLFEGSREFYRDFVSVESVIDQKLWHFEHSGSGIYDIGSKNPKSFYDVAIEVGGSDDLIEWIPMPENLLEHYQVYSCAC